MNMNNKKQEYQKKYYLDNIDKKKQYRKDNKEKIKIQKAEWYQNNKEYNKKYYEDNKQYHQQYYENNKEKYIEYKKEYRKTYKGLKINRLSCWRSRGLISEDYDKIYERYILTQECDNCGILLDEDFNTKKCMDHCHTTGEFRNILCNLCNVNRID